MRRPGTMISAPIPTPILSTSRDGTGIIAPSVPAPPAPILDSVTPTKTTTGPTETWADLGWSYAIDPLLFTVYVSVNGGSSYSPYDTYAGNLRAATNVEALAVLNEALIAITATTAAGESALSTPVTIAAAPTINSATGNGTTTIAVTSTAAGTIVWQTSSDSGTTWVVNALTSANGNLTGLTNGTPYLVEVRGTSGGHVTWFSVPSAATTPSTVMDFSSYLKMDETAGPSHNVQGTDTLTWHGTRTFTASGEILNAAVYDGSAGCYDSGTLLPITGADWSFSGWANIATADSAQHPFCSFIQDAQNWMTLSAEAFGASFCRILKNDVGGGYFSGTFKFNSWTNVLWSSDSGTVGVFNDGVPSASVDQGDNTPADITPVTFQYGRDTGTGSNNKFKGAADELAFANRPWIPPEARELIRPDAYGSYGDTGWQPVVIFTFAPTGIFQQARLQHGNWPNFSDLPIHANRTNESARDPDVFWDGTYLWRVYTRLFSPVTSFGVSRSKCGLIWTHVTNVDCSGVSGCTNAYAPQWAFAADGKCRATINISTDNEATFQIYEVHPTATDMTTWSALTAVGGAPASASDSSLFYLPTATHPYKLFFTHAGGDYIGYSESDSPFTGYSTVLTGATNALGCGQYSEGPQMLDMGGGVYRLLFDQGGGLDPTKGLAYVDLAYTSNLFQSPSAIVDLIGSDWINGTYVMRHGCALPYPFLVRPIILA